VQRFHQGIRAAQVIRRLALGRGVGERRHGGPPSVARHGRTTRGSVRPSRATACRPSRASTARPRSPTGSAVLRA
jgi:hypothetical protein